ncbi:MAG: hypothetical protein GTO55_11020 [Armatimonadetes bacterium]|nr:hypothetical protein [Armatimonadota bacterium]NIN06842.1 hypothetical protein [Armatimonadota bacterium]NIT32139.1 hypothetical protein [Armatimonadota bacterium]
MPKERHLSPSEFKRGYLTFQARESRDAMYKTATFLVQHFWGQPRDMADGMGVLLLTWNQAFYRYGSFDFGLLEDALRANMAAIEELRPRNIQTLGEADEPTIRRLFSAFLDALRIQEGKKKGCKSPVAVAKALHLLAPDFLPLWDDKIARVYGCYYNIHPDEKYVAFAHEMQCLARQLQEYVPPDSGRTFLKLIDEYNYAKHTKDWI